VPVTETIVYWLVKESEMRNHIQALGVLNIVWGAMSALGALIVLLVFGGIMSVVGLATQHDPESGMIAIPVIGIIGGIIFVVLAICAIPAIAIGIGLLRLASWARVGGIVLSAFHLLSIPFGTALGIYGLWVLMSPQTMAVFSPNTQPVRI
jgi:hypothetical protein